MEANQFAWHSTLHTATDHSGVGGGFGGGDSWNGPRDWGSAEYGPGANCVDTAAPFDVAVSFPVDSQGALAAMEVTLSQSGKSCPLSVRLGTYEGMAELSQALEAGMTPIVSYWAANDMLWMDGPGTDGQGPCTVDDMDRCVREVRQILRLLRGGEDRRCATGQLLQRRRREAVLGQPAARGRRGRQRLRRRTCDALAGARAGGRGGGRLQRRLLPLRQEAEGGLQGGQVLRRSWLPVL
ncbi:unnamed protein product [Prorocentrum cordatum]|uniref:Uncharacterized protein n=1 Tax=Prorocentrum cordatum TaxID=2364126 RepID=A0ABN9Y0Y7_9DINO|nr:unnamed protein product [Polarella glacialis]